MIHNIKHIHELYTESHIDELKDVAIHAEQLGLKECADKLSALHLHVRKSLYKANEAFTGLKKVIKTIEVAAANESLEESVELWVKEKKGVINEG